MTLMPVRDVNLHVEVMGSGHPLVLMHGGPGSRRNNGIELHDPWQHARLAGAS